MTSRTGGATRAALWPLCGLTLLLLLLTAPPVQSHPRPDAVAGAPLQYRQPHDCPMQLTLRVRIDGAAVKAGRMVTLSLIESSTDFLHSSERTGGSCFYQGSVQGEKSNLAMAKLRSGFISGDFHLSGRVFEIPQQPAEAAVAATHLSARPVPPSAEKRRCSVTGGVDVEMSHHHEEPSGHHRDRRALKLDTDSTYVESSRKYIQLILIGDQSFYQRQSNNSVQAKDRLWTIGNYISALYKQLGINVITVYTDVFTTDPYTLTSRSNPAGANSSEMLDLFMNYRMKTLSFKTHTAAHLISALKFAGGGDVGLAHLGKLCTFEKGGGVNSDQEANAYGIAATVAHELGHNMGLNHDEEEKNCGTCPNPQGCVMATVGSDVNPVQFSNCSIQRFLTYSVANGLGYCMSDPPADSATAVGSSTSTCGNRIVETGEDCDCGPVGWCNNTCCNASTCKFTPGSTCASGECCNRATCTLMSQGTVCRASRGSCDLPEYCNGSSEWCPQFDDYKVDGTECWTGKAYCFKGRCNDRDSRCAAIFSGSGVTGGINAWYAATMRGTSTGYCSYNESNLSPLTYAYTGCASANQRCGVLYCVGGNLNASPVDPSAKWKGMDAADGKFLDETGNPGATVTGAGYVLHNLKYSGYRDPGMVPNGAECGTNMMCVDSVCVTTTQSVTCPNCNGRGDCTQSGLCFCQTGYRPPDCSTTGGGGSLTNRLPDNTTASVSSSTAGVNSPTTIATRSANPRAAPGSLWLLSGAQLQLLLQGCLAVLLEATWH